jgi:hypothetical protein
MTHLEDKIPYKKYNEVKIVAEPRERFFPLMVDASVFLSADHLQKLIEAKYELYISHRLYEILKTSNEKHISFILGFFYWPWQKKLIKLDIKTIYRFLNFANLKTYTAPPEDREEIMRSLKSNVIKVKLPLEIQEILVDELSFLRRKSSLLLTFRRTLNYFKRAGIKIIDFTNTLKDKKEEIFKEIRGLRYFIAISLTSVAIILQILHQSEEHSPFTLLISGAALVLVVMDG